MAAGTSATASATSGKSKAQKRALRNCRKIRKTARRKKCIKRVNRKFRPSAPVPGTTYDIEVRDKYFNPTYIEIKSGDSLLWTWPYVNKDAHNVNLDTGPTGVDRIDFATPSSPSVGFTWKRTFTVPGTYNFVCSIHKLMTMQVEVSK